MRKQDLRRRQGVRTVLYISVMSATVLMSGCSGKETEPVSATVVMESKEIVNVNEPMESVSRAESTEPEDDVMPAILGIHDIEVMEGAEINLLDGVTASDDRDGDLTAGIQVSDYDASLLDTAQVVKYSVADSAGNVFETSISLTIRSNPLVALEKTMYATGDVNVRDASSQDGEKIGSLGYAESVEVVARDKNTGWFKIVYKDSFGFVSDKYLSDTKPAPKPASKPSSSKGSGGTQTQPSSSGSGSSQQSGGGSSQQSSGQTGKGTGRLPSDDSANEVDRVQGAIDAISGW